MGQAAYDDSAVRRRQAAQPQRSIPLRVKKGGKRRLSPLQAAMRHAVQLVGLTLMAGFAVSLLWSEAQLVELNDQIQDAKAMLVSEQSQHHQHRGGRQSAGPDEDRPQPDHLCAAERRQRAAAAGVCGAPLDRPAAPGGIDPDRSCKLCKMNIHKKACGSARFFGFIAGFAKER